MYSKAAASAAATSPGAGGDLIEVFHRIGVTEGHLHAWASRGPRGRDGVRDVALLSRDAVEKAVAARRRGGVAARELAVESAKRCVGYGCMSVG